MAITTFEQAVQDGHLVTVGGLNKVYNYLLTKISNIGSIYQPKGSTTWNMLLATPANAGDVYNVTDEDPHGQTNANYACILTYTIFENNYLVEGFVKSTDDVAKLDKTYYRYDGTDYVIVSKVTKDDTPKNPSHDQSVAIEGYIGWYEKTWVVLVIGGVPVTSENINTYYSYLWDKLGGVYPNASTDKYGIIKLDNSYLAGDNPGFIKTGYNDLSVKNNYAVKLMPITDSKNGGKAYVTIPVTKKDTLGVVALGFENTSAYDSTKNAALKVDSEGRGYVDAVSLQAGIGIKIEDSKIVNAGVISVTSGTTNGTIKITTADNKTGTDISVKGLDTAAYKKVSDFATADQGAKADGAAQKSELGTAAYTNSDAYATAAQGAKADAAVQKTTAGSSSEPVYIDNEGAKKISTINLGSSDFSKNVANFVNNTTASTVTITGKNVESAVIEGKTATAALLVNGGIVATSGISASKVYNAVWNDISDAIEVQDDLLVEAGYCYYFDGKEYHKTNKYCQKGIIGIHSDTAGSVLGRKGNHKELDISVGGFVLAYVDKQYESGTPLTCTEHGKLTEIKKFDIIRHPERIVGTYWKPEKEEYWGPENKKVFVNNRHWIKVK